MVLSKNCHKWGRDSHPSEGCGNEKRQNDLFSETIWSWDWATRAQQRALRWLPKWQKRKKRNNMNQIVCQDSHPKRVRHQRRRTEDSRPRMWPPNIPIQMWFRMLRTMFHVWWPLTPCAGISLDFFIPRTRLQTPAIKNKERPKVPTKRLETPNRKII
jgi:hypothetical protein